MKIYCQKQQLAFILSAEFQYSVCKQIRVSAKMQEGWVSFFAAGLFLWSTIASLKIGNKTYFFLIFENPKTDLNCSFNTLDAYLITGNDSSV